MTSSLVACPICGKARQMRDTKDRHRPCSACSVGSLKPPPGEWVHDAACRSHDVLSPEAWWPTGDYRDPITQAALEVCASCPVRAQCLDHAIAAGEWEGIWGGLTGAARRAEARSRRERRERDYWRAKADAARDVLRGNDNRKGA